MPATLGGTTKLVFEHDPEAHKLHVEFTVAAGQAVSAGDPVILATNGNIQRAGTAAAAYTILGIAIKDADAGEFAVVAVKGYCQVHAEAAAASLNAGPVQLGAWNATTLRREYAAAAGADDAAKSVVTVGFNVTQAVADGDAIRVILLS